MIKVKMQPIMIPTTKVAMPSMKVTICLRKFMLMYFLF